MDACGHEWPRKASRLTHCHSDHVGASVTVPLRNCTCSHFLLFVWSGLELVRHRGKTRPPVDSEDVLKALKRSDRRCTVRPSSRVVGRTWDLQVRADLAMDGASKMNVGSLVMCAPFLPHFLLTSCIIIGIYERLHIYCIKGRWALLRVRRFFFITPTHGIPVSFQRHRSCWDGWGDASVASASMSDAGHTLFLPSHMEEKLPGCFIK